MSNPNQKEADTKSKKKGMVFEERHPVIVSKKNWKKANSKKTVNRKTKITPWNEF